MPSPVLSVECRVPSAECRPDPSNARPSRPSPGTISPTLAVRSISATTSLYAPPCLRASVVNLFVRFAEQRQLREDRPGDQGMALGVRVDAVGGQADDLLV